MATYFPEIKKNFGFGCMRLKEYEDENGKCGEGSHLRIMVQNKDRSKKEEN